jgi:hypothetical protein
MKLLPSNNVLENGYVCVTKGSEALLSQNLPSEGTNR